MRNFHGAAYAAPMRRARECSAQARRPAIAIEAREQVGHRLRGIAVVRILHLGSLAEQGIRFVEQEDGAVTFDGQLLELVERRRARQRPFERRRAFAPGIVGAFLPAAATRRC
jgi:hypothetical protein